MFILINNIPYNSYAISSFNKATEIRRNSDGTEATIHCINYMITNGTVLKEEYSTEEERNTAYDGLITKLTK